MKRSGTLSMALAAVLAAGVLTGGSVITAFAEEGKEAVTLRLADMSISGLPVFNYAEKIGLLDGYFDDLENYEVTVELSDWINGVDQNTAYAAGEIDFSSMGNVPAVSGAANGYGTKILATDYFYDDEYVFFVTNKSGAESVADLKGKNIGTTIGTTSNYIVVKYLEAAGLTADEVNLLNIGTEIPTSLRTGDIDAGPVSTIVAAQLEEEGVGKVLESDQVPIYNYVVGSEKFVEQYPEITVKVLGLINDTWDYVLENKADYMQFFSDLSGYDIESIELGWKDSFPIKHARDISGEDYEEFTEFVDWMKDIEYIGADVNADDLLDLTYVKELEATQE